MGNFTSRDIYVLDSQRKTKLSGLLIEHWDEHHLMVAVKIGSIVEAIRPEPDTALMRYQAGPQLIDRRGCGQVAWAGSGTGSRPERIPVGSIAG